MNVVAITVLVSLAVFWPIAVCERFRRTPFGDNIGMTALATWSLSSAILAMWTLLK